MYEFLCKKCKKKWPAYNINEIIRVCPKCDEIGTVVKIFVEE